MLASIEGGATRLAAIVSVPARLIVALAICGRTGTETGFSSFGFSRLIVATSVSRLRRVNSIFAACWNPWLSKWTLMSAQRNENIAPVSTKPRASAIAKRTGAAIISSTRRRRRAERDVADAAEMHLVHYLRDDPGVRRLVGDDHRGVFRPLDVQTLDERADVAEIDLLAVHPDLAVLADGDQNVSRLLVFRGVGVRTGDEDA